MKQLTIFRKWFLTTGFVRGVMLLLPTLLIALATASAQEISLKNGSPLSQVKQGMSMDEVRVLLGAPICVRKGDYSGADFGSMWFYCLLPHGAKKTIPKRHPHLWIKFNKQSSLVQRAAEFDDVEWTDVPSHNEDKIEYVFPDNFFSEALAQLEPVKIELDTAALKQELVIWLQGRVPEISDADKIAEVIFEKQVKADIIRQIERVNNEVHKMLQQPKERISPGLISFSGPCEAMIKRAKKIKTGLTLGACYYYFTCESASQGRWTVWYQPHPMHCSEISNKGSAGLMPISVKLDQFGKNRREEFKPTCEVLVKLKLEFAGTTVGSFNPSEGVETYIHVQPQAIFTVSRSVTTGPGLKSPSKKFDSLQKTFAPESLRYTARFRAERQIDK